MVTWKKQVLFCDSELTVPIHADPPFDPEIPKSRDKSRSVGRWDTPRVELSLISDDMLRLAVEETSPDQPV